MCTSPAASSSSFFASSLPSPHSADLSAMECNVRTSPGHHKSQLHSHRAITHGSGMAGLLIPFLITVPLQPCAILRWQQVMLLQKRLLIGPCHFMVKKLAMAFF